MTRYRINIGKPGLSDEKIDKHKDFKKLYYNYQKATKPLYKTPLYKDKKVFLALLLIILLTYLIVEFGEKRHEQDKKPRETEQK